MAFILARFSRKAATSDHNWETLLPPAGGAGPEKPLPGRAFEHVLDDLWEGWDAGDKVNRVESSVAQQGAEALVGRP